MRARPVGPAAHRYAPATRAGRAAAAILAAIVTSAGGHTLATGVPPPATGLLVAVVAMVLPAWWLTRSLRGWERLTIAQLGAQLGAHVLFVLTAAPAAHTGTRTELVLFGHVVGAAVAGAWLRSGERRAVAAAHRAAALLRRLIAVALSALPTPAAPAVMTRACARPSGVRGVLLRHAIVDRGPPLFG